MTESRPYEETICPTILAALITRTDLLKNRLTPETLEELKKLSKCLGPECQMYNKNFRGCGLRWK